MSDSASKNEMSKFIQFKKAEPSSESTHKSSVVDLKAKDFYESVIAQASYKGDITSVVTSKATSSKKSLSDELSSKRKIISAREFLKACLLYTSRRG